MKIYLLVGVLILVEFAVLQHIRAALARGAVSINPVGWIGYGEFADLTVDRASFPGAYWFVVLLVSALALVFGVFIYLVATAVG